MKSAESWEKVKAAGGDHGHHLKRTANPRNPPPHQTTSPFAEAVFSSCAWFPEGQEHLLLQGPNRPAGGCAAPPARRAPGGAPDRARLRAEAPPAGRQSPRLLPHERWREERRSVGSAPAAGADGRVPAAAPGGAARGGFSGGVQPSSPLASWHCPGDLSFQAARRRQKSRRPQQQGRNRAKCGALSPPPLRAAPAALRQPAGGGCRPDRTSAHPAG